MPCPAHKHVEDGVYGRDWNIYVVCRVDRENHHQDGIIQLMERTGIPTY